MRPSARVDQPAAVGSRARARRRSRTPSLLAAPLTGCVLALGAGIARAGAPAPVALAAAAPVVAATPSGAPTWVKPGVRITFDVGSATTGGTAPASGGGLMQVTVVAVDARTVVARVSSFIGDGAGGLFPGPTGVVVLPNGEADYWRKPAELAKAKTSTVQGVTIGRGPYPLGAKTYNAISFKATNATGYLQQTYDTSTGVLLGVTSESTSNGAVTRGYEQYVSTRTIRAPWPATKLPSWTSTFSRLLYHGSSFTTSDVAPPIGGKFDLTVTPIQRLADTVVVKYASGSGNDVVEAFSASSFDGIVIPPDGLRRMTVGQVLDTDRALGVTTKVTANDGRTVTVVRESAKVRSENTFDVASGAMVHGLLKEQTVAGLTTLELTLDALPAT